MEAGEPDIKFAGFSLWVLNRQFPARNDYWDGNWLNVRVRVEARGAAVEVCGPILHAPEIKRFLDELGRLNSQLKGEAALHCMEPNLDVVIQGDARGHLLATIMITPDQMTQSHRFIFSADQTFLSPMIVSCKRILSSWPVRGNP